MAIKAILFDLDGTLLPMDQDTFVRAYFKALAMKLIPMGYDPQKLQESLWQGIGAMVQNDGSDINESVFWKVFSEIHGERALLDKPSVDEFYKEEFNKVQSSCGYTPKAKALIEELKQYNKKLVLATNPLFPQMATEHRIRWAGLSPEDFCLYTTYNNSCYCKPNPTYYQEILDKIGCEPQECIMVGNDVTEDMAAQKLGMQVFLLTDCLINKENMEIEEFPHGDFEELRRFLIEKM